MIKQIKTLTKLQLKNLYGLNVFRFTKNKKGFSLALPVVELAVILYLLSGFLFGLWHPMWIIFLALPIYYWVIAIKKK